MHYWSVLICSETDFSELTGGLLCLAFAYFSCLKPTGSPDIVSKHRLYIKLAVIDLSQTRMEEKSV